MATNVEAVFTEDARLLWPQEKAGLKTSHAIDLFKVGEGGWVDPGTGRQRRLPVSTLRRLDNDVQDIDAIVDGTRSVENQRYPSNQRGHFSKALASGDFVVQSPTSIVAHCFLDFGEFNDNGSGSNPEIWEIGLFQDHPDAGGSLPAGTKLMVAYGTLPLIVKNSGKQVELEVTLTW